jgi:pyruvate kinase
MNINYNKTKIVATVGPASNSKEMLKKLIEAGVDVFRLNFSHGTLEQHKKVIEYIKELRTETGVYVAMLQDLQGPKIRVEEVENNGVPIKEGETLVITIENLIGNSQKVSTSYQDLPKDVSIGDRILIDDGNIELEVIKKSDKEVETKVIYGGILKSRKGINLPNTNVSAPSLTEKDYADLMFGIENEMDWIALSFVRSENDIRHLKNILTSKHSHAKIIAKIEKPQAVQHIDQIIELTDALMVARGDLGVEISMQDVPIVQKMIVKKCNAAGKPVIVATQMMESMIENPRPTRAESTDVANAVIDGADAVMLSAETASGKYPELVVKAMNKIIASVEDHIEAIYHKHYEPNPNSLLFHSDSVIYSACLLAETAGAKAICALTGTGYSAYAISKQRPKANIFIFSRNKHILNKLSLLWGVRCFYYERHKSTDETISDIEAILKKHEVVSVGDLFITLASIPIEDRQRVNMLKLSPVR